MKTRGFTLVELIAVIVVLVGIFLFVFPNLTNMMNTDNQKKYDDLVENLCTAGKSYMYSNLDSFKELSTINSVIEIQINTLINYGNVDKELKNPKNNKLVKNDKLKYTVLSDFSLDCKYIEG